MRGEDFGLGDSDRRHVARDHRLFQCVARGLHRRLALLGLFLPHEAFQPRIPRLGRESYRLDLERAAERRGHAGRNGRPVLHDISFVAAGVEEGLCIRLLVHRADHAGGDRLVRCAVAVLRILAGVGLARPAVVADFDRLEYGPELEVLFLCDRVVLVVVAVAAVKGQAQERLGACARRCRASSCCNSTGRSCEPRTRLRPDRPHCSARSRPRRA